jgi:hypothetical protein
MRPARNMLTAVLVTGLSTAPLAASQRPANNPRASAPSQNTLLSRARVEPGPGPIAAAVRTRVPAPAIQAQRGGKKGPWIGALIGAGGAAAVTYWAAKTYGENEPGGFCEQCFVQWGAFAIPAGALVGAVVGWTISHTAGPHPSTAPPPRKALIAPVAGRRGGGVVVSVRY